MTQMVGHWHLLGATWKRNVKKSDTAAAADLSKPLRHPLCRLPLEMVKWHPKFEHNNPANWDLNGLGVFVNLDALELQTRDCMVSEQFLAVGAGLLCKKMVAFQCQEHKIAKKVFQMLASRNKFINMTLKQNLDAGTYIRLYGYRKINFPFFTFCQPHPMCACRDGKNLAKRPYPSCRWFIALGSIHLHDEL